jgi:hypothetical protein
VLTDDQAMKKWFYISLAVLALLLLAAGGWAVKGSPSGSGRLAKKARNPR